MYKSEFADIADKELKAIKENYNSLSAFQKKLLKKKQKEFYEWVKNG